MWQVIPRLRGKAPDATKVWSHQGTVLLALLLATLLAGEFLLPPWAQAAAQPGMLLRDPLQTGGFGPELVVIPAGRYRRGDLQGDGASTEQPVHEVTISRPFAIGRYEITFGEYDRFCQATGRPLPDDGGAGRGRNPVVHVTWEDAQAYARWLSEQTGEVYRLPTEAEWEYAARGSTQSSRFWGNELALACRFANGADLFAAEQNPAYVVHPCRDGYPGIAPVGSFQPNPFGLYDVLGNVWEWCEDHWQASYRGAPADGSPRLGWDNLRVRRGGSWFSSPRNIRSAARTGENKFFRGDDTGFRVVRDLP